MCSLRINSIIAITLLWINYGSSLLINPIKATRNDVDFLNCLKILSNGELSVISHFAQEKIPIFEGQLNKYIHPSFDNSIDLTCCSEDTLKALLPESLSTENKLVADIKNNIDVMKDITTSNDKITCRLTLFKGIKCPKWHEDNVKFRLLKTYVGCGTEWVDPSDNIIRMNNAILSNFDKDLEVKDVKKIRQAKTGETLVFRGKQATGPQLPPPVLHRSPINIDDSPRMLLTVTISNRN
eukprot:gene4208-8379_t